MPRISNSACTGTGHSPNGTTIENVTFIANCPILIDEADLEQLHLGSSEEEERVVLISSGSITLYYGNFWLHGVIFRCGGDFIMPPSHGSSEWADAMETFYNKMRVIADGDIDINYPLGNFDFVFGPPCPPVIPKFGRLEIPGGP